MNVVDFLTSDRAQAAFVEFADHRFDPARDVPRLRKRFEPDETAALADMLGARPLAQAKFGDLASEMVYSRTAVQQATPWQVARHRSRRFSGDVALFDLGCGLGGDAMWLGPSVVGVDVDAARLAMARHNAAVAGVKFLPVRADLSTLPALEADLVFADPARRDENGRRIFDVERYRPPLGLLLGRWGTRADGMAVKLHPGVDVQTLPAGAEVEFVSLAGDLKEACLWLGAMSAHDGTRATLLPSGMTVTGVPLAVAPEVSDVADWLFEPDAAVIRSGLVGDVAADLGLQALDRRIAYLTGTDLVESPLVTPYAVEDVMPFNGKRLRAHLREKNVGSVTIKKRGSAVDPERLRRSLDLSGDETCVVILTRVANRPIAIVAREHGRPSGDH